MKVLVVGNGFTRCDERGGKFVNVHTASFLISLTRLGHHVGMAQPFVHLVSEAGLNNAPLPSDQVDVIELHKRKPWVLFRALVALLQADFVYIFFPGSWPRLLGVMCRWLRKPYALYVRGEQFGSNGYDSALLSGAIALITETGLDRRVAPFNLSVFPIAPMIEMGLMDQVIRSYNGPLARPLNVLFVGRLEAAKGIPELIKAARELCNRNVDFELRLVGGGDLIGELSVGKQSLSDLRVSLQGVVSDKSEMMKQYEWADVLVLPSHHEGFPRVLFEAMIKSCVVVTTMVGGIPGLMTDEVNCLALPVGDSDAIANAIQRLASDPDLRQRLSDSGRETVVSVLEQRPSHLDAVVRIVNERI